MSIRSWLSWNHAVEIEAAEVLGGLALWAAAEVRGPSGAAPLAHLELPLAHGERLHALVSPDTAFAGLLREELLHATPWERAVVLQGSVEVRATGLSEVDFRIGVKGQSYAGWIQTKGRLESALIDPCGERPWTQLEVGASATRARLLRGAETLLLVAPGAPAPAGFRAAYRPSGTWAR
ncbi:MAG: hypothetical protein JNM84_17540 [Planctomycetes bacterium]|nr:hypothetical protein [Planctomycetota bacterium]